MICRKRSKGTLPDTIRPLTKKVGVPGVSGGTPCCEQEGTRRRKFQPAGILRAKEIRTNGGQVLTASEDSSIRLWQNGWTGLLGYLRRQTTATLNPEQRIVLFGESESQALKAYRDAEKIFGRRGDWRAPFLFPY